MIYFHVIAKKSKRFVSIFAVRPCCFQKHILEENILEPLQFIYFWQAKLLIYVFSKQRSMQNLQQHSPRVRQLVRIVLVLDCSMVRLLNLDIFYRVC